MDEPRDPSFAQPPGQDVPPPESMQAIVPKARLWPVFAVIGVVVIAAALFAYRSLTATDPLRILVAIDVDGYWWEGSTTAARLADELSSQLGELGFDPVKGGDPKVMKILESTKDPKAAAKKLGAGFIIEAHLAPEVVQHPVKDGYFEVRVDAPVTLTYLDKNTTSEARIRGYSGATTKDRAMGLLADSMASQALDAVIGMLLDHPAVKEITGGADMKLLARLNPAISFEKDRQRVLLEASTAYTARAHALEEVTAGKITYLSGAAADDAIVGVGAGGYFVKTADVTPFYSLRRRDVVGHEALETIEWRALDAKDAPGAPLWKGYHIYSHPSSQPDGDRVVFVEDLFGWAKTITIADRKGTTKRVRIDPEHRFVDPQIARGGKYVAVYDRPDRRAPADLMVLDTDTGKEVFGLHTENQSLGSFTWIDDKRLAFVYIPEGSASATQVIAVVDVSKQPLTIERPFHAKESEMFTEIAASRDGSKLAYVRISGETPALGVVSTSTWKTKLYPMEASFEWPSFSPDGEHVTMQINGGGQTDIVAVTLATGAVKRLTQTSLNESLPAFSADGKRVLFEVNDKDPILSRLRRLNRVASVAFEP
ncbi:MAG: hypothetical protein U0441_08200 [Polyangiaceae bacterium]